MVPQYKHKREARFTLLMAGLLGLAGCVSVAPLEPIKNPPTYFRSDNTVEVEFLSPAVVGMRCAERGTAFYGMPVFHAMACGNGKLVTMPEACSTFTGGAYAALVCDARREVKALRDSISPFLWNASFMVGGGATLQTAEEPAGDGNAYKVEFVHPASVVQHCTLLGASVRDGEEDGMKSCSTPERMVLPNPCMLLEDGWYPRTLCHEMAHANGWAMDHPGGSFLSDKKAGVDPADVPPPRAVMASLSSGAPLRKASESPTYLAYAAAKGLPTYSYAALTQPAVLEVSTQKETAGFKDAASALKALRTSVPDFVAEAKVLLASLAAAERAAEVSDAPGKLRLRAPLDLMATARLYQASLTAPKPERVMPHLQYAALPKSEPARPTLAEPHLVFAAISSTDSIPLPDGADAPLVLASAEIPPVTEEPVATAEIAELVAVPPAPSASVAAHTALALRRKKTLEEVAAETEVAGSDLPVPAPPAPGFKPDVLLQWREEGLDPSAAGV